MIEIKSISYEQARSDFLKAEMEKAQNRMKFWQTKIKKAKTAIAEMEAHDNASSAGWEYNFYKDALEALENQPKWISVEDELPPVGEKVLVNANNVRLIAFIDCEDVWHRDTITFRLPGTVTHWMPMPEPPKEGK